MQTLCLRLFVGLGCSHLSPSGSVPSLRHSPLDKSAHAEASVFKQPPPLEPPMSSPPPSLRDPPWPHGGTLPGRALLGDRPPSQNQWKDPSLASAIPGHRSPRPYNKVASSEYEDGKEVCSVLRRMSRLRVCPLVLREGVRLGQTLRRPGP